MPNSRVSPHQSNGRVPDVPNSDRSLPGKEKTAHPSRPPIGIPPDPSKLVPCEDGFIGGPPPPPPKRRRNHPINMRRDAEKRGDVLGFLFALATSHPAEVDNQREFGRLARLARRKALLDPDGFCDEVLDYGAAIIGYLNLRLVFYAERLIERSDFGHGRDAGANLPADVMEKVLPSLIQVQRHLADMSLLRASRDRQRALADAKRADIDQIEKRDRSHNAAASQNGVAHPAPSGKLPKAATGKGRKAAKTTDRLSLTLACDQPSQQFEIARLARQMNSFEPMELGLQHEPTIASAGRS
jgi:hypothetical protein